MNPGLKLLVWIVKSDRGTNPEIESAYADAAAYMNRIVDALSQAQTKIILIINGTENLAGKKYKAAKQQGKLEEEKDRVRQEMVLFGQKLIGIVGTNAQI